MKLLLSCFLLTAIFVVTKAITEEQLKKLNKLRTECQEETGITQEKIESLRKDQSLDDPKVKSYILCFSKKVNLIDNSGNFNDGLLRNRLKTVSTDEEIEQIFQKCVIKKDTPEETASFIFKCVSAIKPDLVIVD